METLSPDFSSKDHGCCGFCFKRKARLSLKATMEREQVGQHLPLDAPGPGLRGDARAHPHSSEGWGQIHAFYAMVFSVLVHEKGLLI